MTESSPSARTLVQTGIEGLDLLLYGGLVPNRMYLVEGDPGSGKTTLALQFLQAGARQGEAALFVTLSESEAELRASAESHGWSLEGIHIVEIAASEESLKPDARYTMFHPSEVELGETINKVLDEALQSKPTRLVFDSLSELRLLAQNPLRYRRQILALKQFFSRTQCTVMLIDDKTGDVGDTHLHSIAHGVISMERNSPDYGIMRRRLQVIKMRGSDFKAGYHDYAIHRGGVVVFPRLVAAEHKKRYRHESVSSGLKPLDDLLGGGLGRGTSTLIMGPAGTGKSTLACQFAVTAAARNEHSALFLFDERTDTVFERTTALGMGLEPLVAAGKISIRQIDPAELSPGEFAHLVRQEILEHQTRIVVIDSLNGFLNATPSERYLMLHLHELLTFLGQQGVTTMLLVAQHGVIGANVQGPIDTSYVSDTVIMMRFFEAMGQLQQSVSVIKKRTGKHERTLRPLSIRSGQGIVIGEPLREFQGIISGVPEYIGRALPSVEERNASGG